MGLPAAATFGLQPPCRPGSMAARTYLSDEADRHVARGAMRSTPRPRTARHLSPRKRGLVDESPRPRSAYGDASPVRNTYEFFFPRTTNRHVQISRTKSPHLCTSVAHSLQQARFRHVVGQRTASPMPAPGGMLFLHQRLRCAPAYLAAFWTRPCGWLASDCRRPAPPRPHSTPGDSRASTEGARCRWPSGGRRSRRAAGATRAGPRG